MLGSNQSDKRVYWEAQLSDQLCGLHCLNNILQAPIYDEISLSEVAIKLETEEAALSGKYVILE